MTAARHDHRDDSAAYDQAVQAARDAYEGNVSLALMEYSLDVFTPEIQFATDLVQHQADHDRTLVAKGRTVLTALAGIAASAADSTAEVDATRSNAVAQATARQTLSRDVALATASYFAGARSGDDEADCTHHGQ